jgi:hypothetical protein
LALGLGLGLAVVAIVPRLSANIALETHPRFIPWVESVLMVDATLPLHRDAHLLEPWQFWTWIGSGPLVWNLVLAVLLVPLAAAAERRVGSALLAVALLVLPPIGAAVLLALGGEAPVTTGAGALVAALAGVVAGAWGPARLELGLGWWAVVIAGWLPVAIIGLMPLMLLIVLGEALAGGSSAALAAVVMAVAGFSLGRSVVRRYAQTDAFR